MPQYISYLSGVTTEPCAETQTRDRKQGIHSPCENSRPNKSNVSSYLWPSHHPDRFLLPLLSVARRGRLLLFFSLLVVGKIASSLHAVPVFQTKTSLLAEPASRGSDRLLQFPSPMISAVFNALYCPVKGKKLFPSLACLKGSLRALLWGVIRVLLCVEVLLRPDE